MRFAMRKIIEVDKVQFIHPHSSYLVDAIEISTKQSHAGFITVFFNAKEPGLPNSTHRLLMDELEKLSDVKPFHDPNIFHTETDKDWRQAWEHKYGCHIHIIYNRIPRKEDMYNTLKILEGHIGPYFDFFIRENLE